MRYTSENTVVLCKRNQSCCPVVDLDPDSGGITIKDDFGGTVKLDSEEVEMLSELLTQKIQSKKD